MPLRSAQDLVSEAALAAVAPLADAAKFAVVQPLQNGCHVVVIHAGHFDDALGSCGDLLGVHETHALALRGLGTERALAIADLAVHVNGDHPGGDKDQAVDDLFVGGQLAGFVHGPLLSRLSLASDTAQHRAGVLKEAFDLVVPECGPPVLVPGEDGHGLIGGCICANGSNFVLNGESIRALAGDELPDHVGIGGPSAQNGLDECDFDFDGFHAFISFYRCCFASFPFGSRTV